MDLLKTFEWRYATKFFDKTKKISDKDWHILSESLRMAPSSYGLQPWKFYIVQNPEIRAQLLPKTWNQTQVTDCSHYVVITYKEKMDEAHINEYIQDMAKTRGIPTEALAGFQKMMVSSLVQGPLAKTIDHWAARQTYIAMGQLMLSAALLEIDSCPIEGLQAEAYDEILNLQGTGYKTIATVALGYRSSADESQHKAKVRFSDEKIIQIIK